MLPRSKGVEGARERSKHNSQYGINFGKGDLRVL